MMPKRKVAVFDLDDTLYKEIDYLKSAYREIGAYFESEFGKFGLWSQMLCYYEEGKDAFEEIIRTFNIPVSKDDLIWKYRSHVPNISLDEETKEVLDILKSSPDYEIAIITDGRSLTQRNKIKALGLDNYLEDELDAVVSEEHGHLKPDAFAYHVIESFFPYCDYVYIGDNPQKDFIAPNQLGWDTICLLDNGRNIHRQDFAQSVEYMPQHRIGSMKELIGLL